MPSIRLLDCALRTYSYNITRFNPVAAATDVWMLSGLVGLTVKIRWAEVGGTAVAARSQPVGLMRRSTASSGGTSTNPTPRKADPADAAASVILTQWTTLPGALGTLVEVPDSSSFTLQTGTAIQDRAIFNYESPIIKSITTNSVTADFICVNFIPYATNSVSTIATDLLDMEIWWTEQ